MLVDTILLLTIVVFVVICPYTKVEESFNMQAIYDHLNFGVNTASYDHLQFPGVVPRTFIGSLVVSLCSFPFVYTAKFLKLEGIYQQMVVRVVLGSLTWLSTVQLRAAIQQRFSRRSAQLFMLFTAFQFHLCFYASRTLPNTFAVLIASLAFAAWLQHRSVLALQLLGIATVVFRCDMLVLVASLALTMLVSQEISFLSTFVIGVFTCLAALCVTVLIDSFFWQKWLWPEGVVLFFNTIENKSSEWGTSPWHWYFSSALPKSLTLVIAWALVCVVIAFLFPFFHSKVSKSVDSTKPTIDNKNQKTTETASTNTKQSETYKESTEEEHQRKENREKQWQRALLQCRAACYYAAPALLFVALYSYLPHKELRFVMPALPLFTLTAAVAADHTLGLFASYQARELMFPLSLLASFYQPVHHVHKNSANSNTTTNDTGNNSNTNINTNNVKKKRSSWSTMLSNLSLLSQLALLASWLLMLSFSHFCLLAAQHNYPGGEALEHFLHDFVRSEAATHLHVDVHQPAPHPHDLTHTTRRLEPTFVHMDNLAATTGVTRFLQETFVHHRHLLNSRQRLSLLLKQQQNGGNNNHQTTNTHANNIVVNKQKQVLDVQYPPHSYLNSLPHEWHQIQAAEENYHNAIIDNLHKSDSQNNNDKNANIDWIVGEELLVYSKHEELLDTDKTEFDFLITEHPEEFLQSGQFVMRHAVQAYDRMKFTMYGPQVVLKKKLFILENAYPHEYVDN